MSKLQRIILKVKMKKSNTLNNKRGAELVESILMVGVAISLIVVVFYPQIMTLMNLGLDGVDTWLKDALSRIGESVV
jgi:hypothetical protein